MVTLRAKENRHAAAITIRSRILNTDMLKIESEWVDFLYDINGASEKFIKLSTANDSHSWSKYCLYYAVDEPHKRHDGDRCEPPEHVATHAISVEFYVHRGWVRCLICPQIR